MGTSGSKTAQTKRRRIARNVNPVIPSEKEEIYSRSKEKKKVSLFRKGNAVHFVTIDKIQRGGLPRSDLDRGQVSDGSEEPDRNANDPWDGLAGNSAATKMRTNDGPENFVYIYLPKFANGIYIPLKRSDESPNFQF